MYSAFVLIVLGPILIKGHYSKSPCPSVFQYKSDGAGTHGVIHIEPTGPTSSIVVRANYTIATRLLTVSVS